jgi:hypothetical protein
VNTDNAEVLVALLLFGATALWRAGTLRPEVVDMWPDRVEDAELALTERATRQLEAMQEEIAEVLRGDGGLGIPRSATFDPALLANRAKDFQATLDRRAGVRRDYKRLRRVGPWLFADAGVYLVGWLAFSLDETELLRGDALQLGGTIALAASAILGLLLVLGYVLLNHRLSGAEILGEEPVDEPSTTGGDGAGT